jgi:hypothetical protein
MELSGDSVLADISPDDGIATIVFGNAESAISGSHHRIISCKLRYRVKLGSGRDDASPNAHSHRCTRTIVTKNSIAAHIPSSSGVLALSPAPDAVVAHVWRNLKISPTVAPDNPSGSIRKGLPMSTRFQIAALVFMMTNAVAFGIGIVPILMIPAFSNHAFEAIPAVVLVIFVVSAPLSWFIAPRLRVRYQRTQPQKVSSRR